MKKWIAIIILITALVIGYNYVFQDHRNIASETATHSLSAKQLQSEIETAPNQTEQKYLNKTIKVSGTISEITPNHLTLNQHVFCAMDANEISLLKVGQSIIIKGRVIGYDDLLEQVKLDQCTIINNHKN